MCKTDENVEDRVERLHDIERRCGESFFVLYLYDGVY